MQNSFKQYNIYVTAITTSLVLSIVFFFYQQPVNVDGIIYLNAAQNYAEQGLKAALGVYRWPFYSIVIAKLAYFTKISLINAAYIINAFFDILTMVCFIALVKELGGNRKHQWLAFLIITFYPYFNHARDEIIRGHGYIPLALLSIFALMRLFDGGKYRYALLWSFSILGATLFRIEGAALLTLLPLCILIKPKEQFKQKIILLLKTYSIPLGIIFLGIMYVWYEDKISFHHLGRAQEIWIQIHSGLQKAMTSFQTTSNALITVLGPEARSETSIILFSGMVGVFIDRLTDVLTPLYVVLSGYVIVRGLLKTTWEKKAILYWAMIINFILLSLFLGQRFFLSGRYILFLSTLLLLLVPFALTHIVSLAEKQGFTHRYRWILLIMAIAFIYIAVDSVWQFGPSKTYLIEAGKWIKHKTPTNSLLYTNEPQILLYAKREGVHYPQDFYDQYKKKALFKKSLLKRYDYLAYKIGRHKQGKKRELIQAIGFQPVKVFHNRRGDKLLIFDTKTRSSRLSMISFHTVEKNQAN